MLWVLSVIQLNGLNDVQEDVQGVQTNWSLTVSPLTALYKLGRKRRLLKKRKIDYFWKNKNGQGLEISPSVIGKQDERKFQTFAMWSAQLPRTLGCCHRPIVIKGYAKLIHEYANIFNRVTSMCCMLCWCYSSVHVHVRKHTKSWTIFLAPPIPSTHTNTNRSTVTHTLSRILKQPTDRPIFSTWQWLSES